MFQEFLKAQSPNTSCLEMSLIIGKTLPMFQEILKAPSANISCLEVSLFIVINVLVFTLDEHKL